MTISRQLYCFSGIVTMYFFFLGSFFVHTLASPMLNYCRHDQRDALLEFKHEFPVNESNSILSLSSWNKSSDCCSWQGVICDAKSGEVISLDLSYIPLNNSLKPNSGLFKLHHLRNLTLRQCYLYGEIPSSLGNFSHLTHLDLWDNDLVGEVMASIGNLTQLGHLDLGNNKFSGNIPFSFANLTKLSHLDISRNQFTCENFPLVLQNLTTSLSFLDISRNRFKSRLPPDMSGFHSLEYFDVGGNSFFGPFPTSLFMIPSLTWVNLWGNQFKGPIEFRNTSSSSKLQVLGLDDNKFDGPIPESISKFCNLNRLVLSHNNFIGRIPGFGSKIVKPEAQLVLELSHNSFSSFGKSFEVSDLTNIWTLDISSNSFRGPLPHSICKLRQIQFLDLSNNSFSGPIPQCLRNTIVDLTELNLQNNNFSGILPPDLFFNTTRLMLLDVSGNQLEGQLPESLTNCTSLEVLNVGRNRIKDKFPSWLGSLRSLQVMILRSNEFYGPLYHPHASIGFGSLKVMDISYNDFNGTLPPFYFSSWREMANLTEEDGVYVGMTTHVIYYSSSIEMVDKGVDTKFELVRKDFGAIDFSGNNFSGKIPKSIGLLKELRNLNLSGNTFTSNIPQSLANLTNLESLDLSRNQLSGQIPQDLGCLSFLSTMNFSHNNLEGPIPRGTQFRSQNCSAFMDNSGLFGFEDVCVETHVPNPTPQESEDLSEPEEQVISWIAAAIAYGPGVFCGLVIGYIFSPLKLKWFM